MSAFVFYLIIYVKSSVIKHLIPARVFLKIIRFTRPFYVSRIAKTCQICCLYNRKHQKSGRFVLNEHVISYISRSHTLLFALSFATFQSVTCCILPAHSYRTSPHTQSTVCTTDSYLKCIFLAIFHSFAACDDLQTILAR